jgi:hypothetical protein
MFFTYYDLKKPEIGRTKRPENATIIHSKIAGVASFYCVKTRRGYYFRSTDIHSRILDLKSYLYNHRINNKELEADFDLYGPSWFRVGIMDEIVKSEWESEATYKDKLDSRLFVSLHDKIYNSKNAYNKKDVVVPIIYQRSFVNDIGHGKKRGEGVLIQDWRKRRGVYVISIPNTDFTYTRYTENLHKKYCQIQYALNSDTCIVYPSVRREYLLHGRKIIWEFYETDDAIQAQNVSERLKENVRFLKKASNKRSKQEWSTVSTSDENGT